MTDGQIRRAPSPTSRPGPTRSARWSRRIGSSQASRALPPRPPRSPSAGDDHTGAGWVRCVHLQRHQDRPAGTAGAAGAARAAGAAAVTPPEPPGRRPATTQLRVVKTAPRVARVGERIPFRLTVTNTGSVVARNVQMADVPPASLALAALKANRPARLGRVRSLARSERSPRGRSAPSAEPSGSRPEARD